MSESATLDPQTIHDTLEDALKLFIKEDYVHVAKSLKITIPGFTHKNYHKAPVSLLKTPVTKKMNRLKYPEAFLENFVAGYYTEYKDTTIHEFLLKIKEEHLSKARAFVLFSLIFPDLYDEHREEIKKNIKARKSPLNGIIEQSLFHQLSAVAGLDKKEFKKQMEVLFENHPHNDEIIDFFKEKEDQSLQELLKHNMSNTGKGYYLKIFLDYEDEWSEWKENEISLLHQLTLQDVMSTHFQFLNKFRQEIDDQKREMKKNEVERKKMEGIYEKEQSKTAKLKKELKEKQRELRNYELGREKREKDLGIAVKDNEKYKRQNGEYQKEIQVLQSKVEELQKVNEEIQQDHKGNEPLFSNDNVLLISKGTHEWFDSFFSKEQLVYLKNMNEVSEYLEGLYQGDPRIYMINTDGFSSKQLFKLEKRLKEFNIIYKFVSNGPADVVRKIAYYLEGELHNEVKETN